MALATSSKSNPGVSLDQFISAVLKSIGAPDTPNNHAFVRAWAGGESTKAANNPLATTQPATGASNFNSVGVKNYPSPTVGIYATAKTIVNGYYPGIVRDLRKGNVPPNQIIQNNASELNKWGTGATLVASRLEQGVTQSPTPLGKSGIDTSQWGGTPPATVLPVTGNIGIKAGAKPDPGIIPGAINSAENAITSPLKGIAKDIAYSIAIAGGGFTILVGLILIGVDIGLDSRKRLSNSVPVRSASRVRNQFGNPVSTSQDSQTGTQEREASRIARERRTAELHAERVKRERAKTRKARADARLAERRLPRPNKKSRPISAGTDDDKRASAQGRTFASTGDDIPF